VQCHAVDVNESMLTVLCQKATSLSLTNIITYPSIQHFMQANLPGDERFDILLTEVVEHMTREDAETLIELIISNIPFNSFIITTPNRAFNVHYSWDETHLRHEDHKWEMTRVEFVDWMNKLIPQHYRRVFSGVGCEVNSESVTSCVVISIQEQKREHELK